MRLIRSFVRLGILLAIVVTPTLILTKLAAKSEFSAIAQTVAQSPAQSSEDLRSQQITEAVYLKQSGYDRLQKADPQGAIADLQKALELFRKWKATGGELDTLNILGDVYLTTGQYDKAMPYFQQALVIAKDLAKFPDGDPVSVGYTLQYIADVYDKQRQYAQALPLYQQALDIFRDRLKAKKGDRDSLLTSESVTLSRMASIYFKSSQYDLALASYQQMLPRSVEQKDTIGRVQTLNNIGVIYANQTQYAQALESYEQSLALVRTLCCYRGDEAAIINNISALYYSLGQNRRALELAEQATKIYFKLTPEDFVGLKKTEIELLHDVLGEDNSNPTLTSRGLSVRATVGDTANDNVTVKAGQANNLNNIAQLYSNSGKYKEALNFFQKAKVAYQEIGNDLGIGITLDNIGSTYSRLGQLEQAIAFHQQALAQYEKVKDLSGTGVALSNLGRAYANLGKQAEAIASYQQAIKIAREVRDRSTESVVLANIGDLLTQQKQFESAIAYLKESINVREAIRQSIRMLPREDRSAYKQSVSYTYRNLAKLLLQQNRINEAIQILDLLKVQELQDYLRDVKGNDRTAIGITLFDAEKALINTDVKILLNGSPLVTQIQNTAARESLNLATSRSLLANVQRFGDRASLFYPLLFEDQLFLVLLPAKSAPILRSLKVNVEEFTKLLQDFRADLQDASSADVKESSAKLYRYLIKPIEADLQAANIDLLLYAPDGKLRYIPLSALYDGKKWLIERYGFNYLTASGFLDFPSVAKGSLKIIAAAFTQGDVKFEIGNEKFTFKGLPFAGKEIDKIATTFPDTTKLVDTLFNRQAIVSQFGNYSVIHLATHAAFVNGTPEDSFVLMGNGDRLNLRELREWKLPNTQLVVLSACQTALGGVVGSGEEILGFGYQIQRTGAKAAIASLWTVSDQGTQLLMSNFYTQLQKGSNVINSLRQAQLGLLQSPQSNLQHPYFWASFILIGNGK
ncbi:CHAT domain-containing protein [Pseudanabaena sp. FACHB-1998]|uniref:CHAT domain-containing protein n=1 Tax=Pseudanabaena sp. FACHB-1998 TaxID=2692858 RepID=UPI0016800DE6|nr:CHAT domain-containing protein [Pseudanabaena sp. FACHB-1998]MBD2178764.1 CHAT domain-containing protein [Pseudanabaena sp. FACHB-1998]